MEGYNETSGNDDEYNLGFIVGETFRYSFYWGIILVGHFEMSSQWLEQNGQKLIKLYARAKTLPWVSKIYPVDDYFESLVDPFTFLPILYVQDVHEGKKVRKDRVKFFHFEKKAYWKSLLSGKKREVDIPEDTRDVLTLVYHMRKYDMAVGERRNFKVFVDNKLYDLQIDAIGREKLDNNLLGKVGCIKIEPIAKFGEVFVRKGRIHLWFLEDKRHWCIKVIFYLPIANFRAELENVDGSINGEK